MLVLVVATFGLADSIYLSWQWYEAASSTWCDLDAYFSCTKVRESPFSSLAGIPTATVGVGGFGMLLALAVVRLRGLRQLGPWSVESLLVAFAGAGAVVGAVLTLVEIFVIEAICVLCVVGFAADVGILGLALLLAKGALA